MNNCILLNKLTCHFKEIRKKLYINYASMFPLLIIEVKFKDNYDKIKKLSFNFII